MSFFSDAKTDDSIKVTDSVGGGYKPLESGIYAFIIKEAYGHVAASGAKAVSLKLEQHDAKVPFTLYQTIYVTRSTKNGGGNTWDNNGKAAYLPGFQCVDGLIEILMDTHLSQVQPKQMIVKKRDPKTNQDVNEEVPMIEELIGKPIYACVKKKIVNVNKKGGDGNYYPTNERREENEIVQFLRASDKRSVPEIKSGEEPTHYDEWLKVHEGVTKDVSKDVSGAPAAAGGTPAASAPASSATAAAGSNLFK